MGVGFRVGFGVEGLGFRLQGSGFRVWGLSIKVGFEVRVEA